MCGEEAAVRNHRGHGPKPSSTTTRARARCHAASLSEIAARPTRSCSETALNAARARRLRRGWSSTDQSHACVSSRYFTWNCGTSLGRRDRCLDVAADFCGAGETADQASGAVSLGRDRHDLRDLTIAVEDDNRLSAGRTAYELARAVTKLADLDALHDDR